jgi:transcriptional regulator with XRE-family HTH domain
MVNMDLVSEREHLRQWLCGVSLQAVIDATGISRSWLSKFRRGEILDPGMERLAELHECRQSLGGRKRARAA